MQFIQLSQHVTFNQIILHIHAASFMFQDIHLMNCMKREEAEMKETRVQVGFKSSICILSGKAISMFLIFPISIKIFVVERGKKY